MGKKQNELGLLLHEGKYDLIGITETEWDDSHDWNIAIEGYTLFKMNRRNRKGGRVSLYVKNTHPCTEIQAEELRSETTRCLVDWASLLVDWASLPG